MIFYKTLKPYNKHYTNAADPQDNLYLSKNVMIDRKCYKANLMAVYYGEDFKNKVLNKNLEHQTSNYFVLNIDEEYTEETFDKWKTLGYQVVKLSEINQMKYLTLKNVENYVSVIFDNVEGTYEEDEECLLTAILQYVIMKGLKRDWRMVFDVLNDIKTGKKKIPNLKDVGLCDTLQHRLECLMSDETKETSFEEVPEYADKIIYVMDIHSEKTEERMKNATTLFLFISTMRNCNFFLDHLNKVGNVDSIKFPVFKTYNTFFHYFAMNEEEFKKEFGKNADRILYTADILVANYYDKTIDYYLRRCENWLKQYNHKFYERFWIKNSLTYKNISPEKCFVLIRSAYPILDKCM